MAKKKKTKKALSKPKPKKSSARKTAPRKAPLKKAASKKKAAAKKKPAPKKTVAKKKVAPKKKTATRKATARKVTAPVKTQGLDTVEIERGMVRRRAGIMSGDLQGLSRKAGAASESVDELLEEGNAYEAGILQGVEEAEEADEDEVVSHEVLADDVPKEYLDED